MKRKKIKPDNIRIAAIDPSPTGTAIVCFKGQYLESFYFTTEAKGVAKKYEPSAVLLPKPKLADENGRMQRLSIQRELVRSILCGFQPHYIGLEDYVFGSGKKSGGVYQIAELGGVLRLMLWESGVKVRTYHPGSVKLAFAQKWRAEKPDMIEAATRFLKAQESEHLPRFNELADKYQEGISDAIGIWYLLRVELRFRNGLLQVSDMPKHLIRVFNRVTDSMPVCLIDREWMQGGPYV